MCVQGGSRCLIILQSRPFITLETLTVLMIVLISLNYALIASQLHIGKYAHIKIQPGTLMARKKRPTYEICFSTAQTYTYRVHKTRGYCIHVLMHYKSSIRRHRTHSLNYVYTRCL